MRKLRAALCACGMLVGLVGLGPIAPTGSLAHAQSAPAPGKEHARRLFDEGSDLEKKGEYAAALAKFREAEQITATAGLRFHKGYCLEMMGRLSAALEEYEAADKLAREQNKQDVHAATAARMDPVRSRVPQIAIRLATPAKDADVQLDGVAVAAPLLDGKAFRLEPGEHIVTARAGGYKPFTRKVHVPESITTTVDVSLDPVGGTPVVVAEGAAPSSAVTEPPSEPSHGRSRLLPIATTAGAVVLAGVGVTMFLVAGGKQSSAQRDCPSKTTCDDERSSVRTFDALALGGMVGAVGLGVLSAVLWTAKAPGRSALTPSTRMTATPRTIAVEGTFW